MKYKPAFTHFFQKLIPMIVITTVLSILLASCISPSESIFEGLFSSSFEVSVFYPCSMSNHTGFIEGVGYKDLGYWLVSTPGSGFNGQLEDFHSQREPTGALNMYIKFVGVGSPTKEHGYGHLGMYSKQITVIEVLDMKPWSDSECVGVNIP